MRAWRQQPRLRVNGVLTSSQLYNASPRLMSRLAELAVAVEAEMGCPQDIEGCVVGEHIYVLQSRNQVL